MADGNKRIQDLPPISGSELATQDVLPIVDVSGFATKKVRFDELKTEIVKDTQPKLPNGASNKVLGWDEDNNSPAWVDFSPTGSVLYIGDPNEEGSWRMSVTPQGLLLEVRVLGAWEKRSQWNKE